MLLEVKAELAVAPEVIIAHVKVDKLSALNCVVPWRCCAKASDPIFPLLDVLIVELTLYKCENSGELGLQNVWNRWGGCIHAG